MSSGEAIKLGYAILKSPLPTTILLVIIAVFTFLMYLLHRKNYGWLLWSAVPTMLAGLFFIVVFAFSKSSILVHLSTDGERLESVLRPFVNLFTNSFITYGIILLGISIVMIIGYIILRKKIKKL